MKNKRGFTLIELLVCFTLITILSISLFKTVLVLQQKQMKNLVYNQYIAFVATFNNAIQKDFINDRITNIVSCDANCYDITYLKGGQKRLSIDRNNNTIIYGSIKEKLPNNYIYYADMLIDINTSLSTLENNYNSIVTLTIPIKSNLVDSASDIKYIYQYDNRVNNIFTSLSILLTVDPNGGTYNGSTEDEVYPIYPGDFKDLLYPTREGYIFNGWTVTTCQSCLSGNRYTASFENDTITAKWISPAEMYAYTGNSTFIDDEEGNWRIKFLTNGTFTPKVGMTIDVFLVGGGGGGSTDYSSSGYGGGGGSGYTETYNSINLTANQGYSIVIGAAGTGVQGNTGGDGGTSYITSSSTYFANGGKGAPGRAGGAGGSGGGSGGTPSGGGGSNGSNGVSGQASGGAGQGTTTREFEELTGTLYAGGGGGYNSSGGDGGGGNGGDTSTAGAVNTGSGGGGGNSRKGNNGSNGGTGIVVIRNHR